MVYRSIGVMSGSSLDGLDLVFTELEERAGKWAFEIKAAECITYPEEWITKLENAASLNAYEYLLLHTAYGRFIGESANAFIEQNNLFHQVQLIASHGHTVFHAPENNMTAQLGDGATIAAVTGINVVSDLRNIDVALGGQGAPIVPVGEKLLLDQYKYYLNLGGIANISANLANKYVAFDVCPANRILNLLAAKIGKSYDEDGAQAKNGSINQPLLEQLNSQSYYQLSYPKSLANSFGLETIYPIIEAANISTQDALSTYTEHIAQQISFAIKDLNDEQSNAQMLITGGGAFNSFLVERIQYYLQPQNIAVVVPGNDIIKFKEALIMALLGILRWREEYTVLSSVTGADRNSIGGAVWIGQDA